VFRQILVPMDGSRQAESALERALAFAQPGVKLALLRVTPEPTHPNLRPSSDAAHAGHIRQPDLAEIKAINVFAGSASVTGDARIQAEAAAATAYVEDMAQRLLARGIHARVMTCAAATASAGILQTAASIGSDLIVMGSHGRGGLKRLLIGSTADAVVRGATMPVVVCRGATSAASTRPVKRVLVPLDGSALAERALGVVSDAGDALLRDAHVELLRVTPPPDSALLIDQSRMPLTRMADLRDPIDGLPLGEHFERDLDVARQYLDGFARTLRGRIRDVEAVVTSGDPVTGILDTAKADAIDLIVMASHGRGGLQRALLGSVTDGVLRRARCPVMVVPGA
jgi:nucleotide-binding universal stress UspA family protein